MFNVPEASFGSEDIEFEYQHGLMFLDFGDHF